MNGSRDTTTDGCWPDVATAGRRFTLPISVFEIAKDTFEAFQLSVAGVHTWIGHRTLKTA